MDHLRPTWCTTGRRCIRLTSRRSWARSGRCKNRRRLRAHPVAAPALAASNLARSARIVDPDAPNAGLAASFDVEGLHPEKRIEQVLRRVPPYLPEAMRADFMKILEPQALVMTVAVLAVWAGSHAIGIGFIVDALLLVTAPIFTGKTVIDCAETLRKSLELMSEAKEEKHLEESARLLGQVVATIGVTVFVAVIARGATRTLSAAAQGKGLKDSAQPGA